MQCPKCAGPMWDNRQTKRNPKSPDYKCKDKGCDGVVWPEKKGGGTARFVAGATAEPSEGFDDPPPYDDPYAPVIATASVAQDARGTRIADTAQEAQFSSLIRLHRRCFDSAVLLVMRDKPTELFNGWDAISALTAQLFIEANKRGIVL